MSPFTLDIQFPVSFASQRNATGHIIHSDGIQKHMIEALSQTLNFRWVKYRDRIAFVIDYT